MLRLLLIRGCADENTGGEKSFVMKKLISKNPGCVSQVTSPDPNQTYLDVVWPRTR
jgi:hypothetical protein